MSWPSHTDYQDAIQNPQICFEEASLKLSEIGCDMLGMPRVISGNFASVYSVTTGGERWAIRCFVRQVLGQQGRYARLSQSLFGLGLPCMVAFEYILRGIKVRNEWYPIVKMAWVEGLPLNQWVEENYRDAKALTDMAAKWVVMMKQLRDNNLAHSDLQHGNVMVTTTNELRLVDYDGMYTPAFKGRSPEMGHANFQHPRRTPEFYNEQLDNFASLIIYTTFLAYAAEPDLFNKFFTGDNLLFLSGDYRNPQSSEAIKRLKESTDQKVKDLATLIEKVCLMDVSRVPEFGAVAEAVEKGTISELIKALEGPAPVAAPAPAPAARPAPSVAAPKPAAAPMSTPMTRPVAPVSAPKAPVAPRPPAPRASPLSAPKPAARPAAPAPAHAPAKAAGPGGLPMWFWIAIGAGILIFVAMFIFGRK